MLGGNAPFFALRRMRVVAQYAAPLALLLAMPASAAWASDSAGSRPAAHAAVAVINVAGAFTVKGTDTCKDQPFGLPVGKPSVVVINKWSGGGNRAHVLRVGTAVQRLESLRRPVTLGS